MSPFVDKPKDIQVTIVEEWGDQKTVTIRKLKRLKLINQPAELFGD